MLNKQGDNIQPWCTPFPIWNQSVVPFPIWNHSNLTCGFPGGSQGKAYACNAGDLGSIPGSGRSAGEGNGHPLQYSCLGNPIDKGTWQAAVHGVARVRYDLMTKPLPPPKPHWLLGNVFKTTMRYYYTLTEWLKQILVTRPNAGEDTEKLDHFILLVIIKKKVQPLWYSLIIYKQQ